MIIAMTISVAGAGKSLPGDSTPVTFAAGEKDFTLAVTLRDLQRHPLYHVGELLFSGAYAMVAGPFIARTFVVPAFSRLGVGSGAVTTMRGLTQAEFRRQYPGTSERFQQLQEGTVSPSRDGSCRTGTQCSRRLHQRARHAPQRMPTAARTAAASGIRVGITLVSVIAT